MSLVATTPLFYGIGWFQGDFRANIVYIVATAALLIAVTSWALSRANRLTLAIHLFVSLSCLIILIGSSLSGRAGPVVWLLTLVVTIASIHRSLAHALADAAIVGGSAVFIATTLPHLDPAQFPTLGTSLVLMSLLTLSINRMNTDIQGDILRNNSELLALNNQLEVERNRSDAANEAKNVFLATMSHELRTPLNAVVGYTQMIQDAVEDGDADPDELLGDLKRIESASRQLLLHVSRILDLSHLDTRAQSVATCIDLPAFLDSIAGEARQQAQASGLRFELEVGAPTVWADASQLRRLLTDLLDNACRFTPEGAVGLRVEGRAEGVALEVWDTGIGIPLDQQERVFDLFTQVDGSYTRSVGGVGLGLALCRRLADTLQATLSLQSVPGEGTTVTVLFPHPVSDGETQPSD